MNSLLVLSQRLSTATIKRHKQWVCKFAFDTVLEATTTWLYTDCAPYPDMLEQMLDANYITLVEMYASSGVYVADKDLHPGWCSIVHVLSELYHRELIGALKREDPCFAAYQVRCVDFDPRKIAIIITV